METLAVAPDEDGYSYSEGTDYLYAEREGYLPATRADVINSNKIVNVQWTVGIDEYKYLCDFNKANLGNDSEPFLCPLILDTAEAKDYECTIVPNSFAVPSQSGETYTVTAQLEVVPDPFTDDEIEDGTTSNAGTGNDGEGYYAGSQELNTANFVSVKRGRFVLSGLPTVLKRPSRFMTADKANFVLTGQAAGSDSNKVVFASKGQFNLNGQAAVIGRSRAIVAGFGSFVLSGQSTYQFSPASLFGAGDTGGFWDFTDAASLFSDGSRTTLATVGGMVRGVTDKSGQGRHLATGASTILRQAGYTDFPGNVDGFVVPQGQVGSATNGYFCIAAIRPVVGAAMAPLEADYGAGATRVAQALIIDASGNAVTVYFNSAGTSPVAFGTGAPAFVTGTDYIFANQHDTAGGSLRVNRSVVASDVASATPNASASGWAAVGSGWEGTNSSPSHRPFHGRMYAAFWINRQLTGPELIAIENWFGAKIGI